MKLESIELENRKKIINFYLANNQPSGRFIAKKLKFPQRTVAGVLKRYKDTLSVQRAPRPSVKYGPRNKDIAKKVLRSCFNNPSLSDNDRAQRYGTSRTNVQRIRQRAGLKSFKARKHPNRTDKQNLTAISRGKALKKQVLTKFNGCIMQDDETYLKRDFRQLPGLKYYVSTIRGNVPSKYKFVCQDKYAKKYMIWQGICSCGLKSRSFVTSSNMDRHLYISECLQKRVLPFIRAHNSPVKFWPDLASCHYAKDTIEWYQANEVDFITKDLNPPNCPNLRPIEKYWAIMKRKLKKTESSVGTTKQLLQKWNTHAKKVSSETIKSLMKSIHKNVNEFIKTGE
jgi:hypothetical protein